MAQVLVRNLDSATVDSLKRRAAARGHSLEQELRDLLHAAAHPTRQEVLAETAAIRALTPPTIASDVDALLRQDRDR